MTIVMKSTAVLSQNLATNLNPVSLKIARERSQWLTMERPSKVGLKTKNLKCIMPSRSKNNKSKLKRNSTTKLRQLTRNQSSRKK